MLMWMNRNLLLWRVFLCLAENMVENCLRLLTTVNSLLLSLGETAPEGLSELRVMGNGRMVEGLVHSIRMVSGFLTACSET